MDELSDAEGFIVSDIQFKRRGYTMRHLKLLITGAAFAVAAPVAGQGLMDKVEAEVNSMEKFTQVMVDKIFSFSELGQQEFETSGYITRILEENGWEIDRGSAGIPTAWFARWGTGAPVIALGSDIDGIPKANQKPGVAWHDPIVPGAPGHGEGHNSGQAVNVTAALALQKVMMEEEIQGTLVLWPGVAEEQLGSKAWFVRDGYFDDIDAVIFTHVGNNLGVTWGATSGTGLVSVEFSFQGESAHSAGSPWRARSSLDAVELMNVGWNFRREHLHPNQRSHYVITIGGDQPNVVPQVASVWYYIREMDFDDIQRNYDIAKRMAEGAALMTNTEMSYQVRGAAAPRHFNKVIAEAMWKHIEHVGLPQWSEDDQALARAVQMVVEADSAPGLATKLEEIGAPKEDPNDRRSGGSDDIGDISWTVPTVTLRFPSNIPGLQGHHWSNAIAMATPIAHKGATAGARVLARTALELFTDPTLVTKARAYFTDVQNKGQSYQPFITADDPPPIDLNTDIMAVFRPQLEEYYFDETRYDTYLEQLGITYPMLRPDREEEDH